MEDKKIIDKYNAAIDALLILSDTEETAEILPMIRKYRLFVQDLKRSEDIFKSKIQEIESNFNYLN